MLAADGVWVKSLTIAVPAVGGLIVGVLCWAIPEKRPHGPADAIRAAQSLEGSMPFKGGALTAAAAVQNRGCTGRQPL